MAGRNKNGAEPTTDPWPYSGPLRSAGGRAPFNGYIWPTEQWRASDKLGHSIASMYERIDVLQLNDGRWSTGLFVFEIEQNRTIAGLQCCFGTRLQAIRAQAARLARRCKREGRSEIAAWAVSVARSQCQTEASISFPTHQPDLFGVAA